jgi:triacylglycerol lipase
MSQPESEATGPWVILLHGMARSPGSMNPLARELNRAGYRVSNVGYPSRPYGVGELVQRYVRPAFESCCRDGQAVHVVTHSLGGILVRYYLQTVELPAGSRIVMLAPPNQGSEVADHVRHWPLYRWWTGRVGQQMGTGEDGIVHRLRPINAEIGVIAANRSIQPWFSTLIPGPDDGAVSVAGTRLPEMSDHLVVDSSHSILMFNRKVRDQVLHFLAEGRFAH